MVHGSVCRKTHLKYVSEMVTILGKCGRISEWNDEESSRRPLPRNVATAVGMKLDWRAVLRLVAAIVAVVATAPLRLSAAQTVLPCSSSPISISSAGSYVVKDRAAAEPVTIAVGSGTADVALAVANATVSSVALCSVAGGLALRCAGPALPAAGVAGGGRSGSARGVGAAAVVVSDAPLVGVRGSRARDTLCGNVRRADGGVPVRAPVGAVAGRHWWHGPRAQRYRSRLLRSWA